MQTVEPEKLKAAVAFNQARRAAEADMLDQDFILQVMGEEEMLHEEEQDDDQ